MLPCTVLNIMPVGKYVFGYLFCWGYFLPCEQSMATLLCMLTACYVFRSILCM
jgi:hypothetical protein